jgi:hypothetical protein
MFFDQRDFGPTLEVELSLNFMKLNALRGRQRRSPATSS